MEEEKNKVEKTKTSNFKTVQNNNSYKNYDAGKKEKAKLGFGRGFLIPFASGILGCSIVIGTCFGVPSIRNSILGTENSNS